MADEKYYSIPMAAKKLGVNRVTLYRRVKSGRVKAIRVGRNYLIPREDIDSPLPKHIKRTLERGVDTTIKRYKETLTKLKDS